MGFLNLRGLRQFCENRSFFSCELGLFRFQLRQFLRVSGLPLLSCGELLWSLREVGCIQLAPDAEGDLVRVTNVVISLHD